MGCDRLVVLIFGPRLLGRDAGRYCFIGSRYLFGNVDFMLILPD